jgi:hypothetical protein
MLVSVFRFLTNTPHSGTSRVFQCLPRLNKRVEGSERHALQPSVCLSFALSATKELLVDFYIFMGKRRYNNVLEQFY